MGRTNFIVFSFIISAFVSFQQLPAEASLPPMKHKGFQKSPSKIAINESQLFVDEKRGFRLDTAQTKWDIYDGVAVQNANGATKSDLQFVARSPQRANAVQPTLTMRVDSGEWKSARHYAEKWLKDYPKFGYELEMSRENRFGNLEGYEIELKASHTNRRVRQFIVKRQGEMWVFTCSADKVHFFDVWQDCEKILKTARVN